MDHSLYQQGLSAFETKVTTELTALSRQWRAESDEPIPEFALWMASSEVDQKFLGHFAKVTERENAFLSSMLFKVLGLSVLLSRKLLRARKLRRLDPTRDTKSVRELYHHIIWLSREGLVIVEQYVLPMVADYVDLKVLSYKLRASFYHIFVLFHNQPSINQAASLPSFRGSPSRLNVVGNNHTDRSSISSSPPRHITPEGGPVGGPPGLTATALPKAPSASFLLPATDYIPTATSCFQTAATLATQVLPGSHPIRLSVMLEYAAYVYDCIHDAESCRRIAKQTIADVYNAKEGMDDESFEDAAELVGILGKMMKRGLNGSSGTPGSRSRSDASRSTPRASQGQVKATTTSKIRQNKPSTPPRGKVDIPPAVPSPGMANPI